jgi:hypothetical protein
MVAVGAVRASPWWRGSWAFEILTATSGLPRLHLDLQGFGNFIRPLGVHALFNFHRTHSIFSWIQDLYFIQRLELRGV